MRVVVHYTFWGTHGVPGAVGLAYPLTQASGLRRVQTSLRYAFTNRTAIICRCTKVIETVGTGTFVGILEDGCAAL